MSKTTKQTGTKTSSTKVTPKDRVANRGKKIAAKHQAIREAGKAKAAIPQPEAAPQPAASANPLLTARGPEFTDVLNAATVEQLEEALKHPGLSNQYRNRIGITLKLRTTPADDVAKTVEAVETGDLAKGVKVPMPTRRGAAGKRDTLATGASGGAGSTNDATAATDRPTRNCSAWLRRPSRCR